MKLRIPFAVLTAAALTVLSGGVAQADEHHGGADTLHPDAYTCTDGPTCDTYVDPARDGAYGKWVTFKKNGDDSPLDSNTKAFVAHTPSNSQTGNYDVVELSSNHSLNLNKAASAVHNLSFDAYKPALQGGSPRIDVVFSSPLDSDGSTYVAIDAGNCQQTLTVPTWVRADATGRKSAGCTIYTSHGTGYTSDGTSSAWDKFVAANPDAFVSYTFMVFDEPSGNTGIDYRVDRVALGTGKYYNASNSPVACGSEAAC
jgi:hypothetical protein